MLISVKDLTHGTEVVATFEKHSSKHLFKGSVIEVSTDSHALPGTWVSIKVTKWDEYDPTIERLIAIGYNVMVPLNAIRNLVGPEKDKMRPIVRYDVQLINLHTGMTWDYSVKDLHKVNDLVNWAIDRGLAVKYIKGQTR